jgi:myosin heavy subunit
MFNMVVEAANKGCASAKTHSSYIGVLDMMGFEVLKDNNSFEQLLINSASEELQAVFNSSLVQSERRAYSDEGVDSSKLDLKDNRALLNMFRTGECRAAFKRERAIDPPTELFPFLDEFTSLATGTDALFLQKLGGSKAEDVCLDPLVDGFFVIKHFAGPVSYSGAGLLEKNKAAVVRACVSRKSV